MRILAALLLTLSLVACGSDEPTGHDADVAFTKAMIRHQADSLVLIDGLAGQKVSARTSELAETIRTRQSAEIEQMVGWLEEWDEKVPSTSRDHINADHDIAILAEVDWLTKMTKLHQEAIRLAIAETENGNDKDAIDLARKIVSVQGAEIARMNELF